jgi:hypothetical protein
MPAAKSYKSALNRYRELRHFAILLDTYNRDGNSGEGERVAEDVAGIETIHRGLCEARFLQRGRVDRHHGKATQFFFLCKIRGRRG